MAASKTAGIVLNATAYTSEFATPRCTATAEFKRLPDHRSDTYYGLNEDGSCKLLYLVRNEFCINSRDREGVSEVRVSAAQRESVRYGNSISIGVTAYARDGLLANAFDVMSPAANIARKEIFKSRFSLLSSEIEYPHIKLAEILKMYYEHESESIKRMAGTDVFFFNKMNRVLWPIELDMSLRNEQVLYPKRRIITGDL